MQLKLNAICVFCGSSLGQDKTIPDQAFTLGKTLAEKQITVIYGGARLGIMHQVAQGALTAGGKVIGIIPQFLKKKEVLHTGLSQLITTTDMHERKLKMQNLSDGFIVLPGGFGTLEELFEVATWSQLALHQKPIGILNINGFYDAMLKQMEHMVTQGFLSQANYELLLIDTAIEGLLEKMQEFKAPESPKWLKT